MAYEYKKATDPAKPVGNKPHCDSSTKGKQKMEELWSDRPKLGSKESKAQNLDADKFD